MEINLKTNPDGSMQKAGRGPALFANAPHVYLDADSAAPAFSAVSTYVAGDMVSYEHNTYICVFDKGTASDVTPDVDTQHWSRRTVIDYATGLVVSTVPYSIVDIAIENHAASLLDRTINRVDASSETGTLTLTLPSETAGKSRDLYLAITCGAMVPTLSVLNATLRNSVGTAADLTLAASATTLLRLTETVNATTSPAADPVFTVTGGMNGGSIRTVKVNGAALTPDASGAVDITVPTQPSDIGAQPAGSYVTANTAITGATHAKITYDSKGLVTGGAALDASDIPTLTSAKISDFQSKVQEYAPPTDVSGKLNSTSAAPAFSDSPLVTYAVGDYVTYNGDLYMCSTATTGGTWDSTKWTAADMTSPDATLDVTSQGSLRVVSADGQTLWQQGYKLASASSATLSNDAVNNFTFADGATTQAFALPTAPTGKVGDFILDIDNSANTSEATISFTNITNNTASVVIPKGENLNDMLSIAAGELARFYITLTTFHVDSVNKLPTWHIVKQVVENGGAQS